jgi:hypothetical protein
MCGKPKAKKHRRTAFYEDVRIIQYRYEIWPGKFYQPLWSFDFLIRIFSSGNNQFYCGGGLMIGPHSKQLKISIALILTTWISYAMAVLPFLNHDPNLYLAIIALFTVNYQLLFITAFTEVPMLHRILSLL